jgi:signal transduction histidine kinase
MRRPWQIWTLFAFCLAMVLPAMMWLTHMALELDRAEAKAQRQADMEETIGSALWQIDTELARLLAPEIARPSIFYQPFYATPSNDKPVQQNPSPLLTQPSPYVVLHFELDPAGNWMSPQCPPQAQYELALDNDLSVEAIEESNRNLAQLAGNVRYEDLLGRLPEQFLPAAQLAQADWGLNQGLAGDLQQSKVVKNTLDYEPIQQQLEINQSIGQLDMNEQQQAQPNPFLTNSYNQQRNQRAQTRRTNELQNRDAVFQAAARQAIVDQRFNFKSVVSRQFDIEGVSQPLWVHSHLLLARRVQSGGRTLIQGCWLDWPSIRQQLIDRIASSLPGADLEPVVDMDQVRLSRVLASLPVHLVVSEPAVTVNPLSPIRVALMLVWLFLALATIAVAVLLRGVVALSERRAAFVSAVTHELRTPLTTFRMYAEMLADGMVTDDDRRQDYLETLRLEADRLSHLVENVLQYARLERVRASRHREQVSMAELVDRIGPRLADRASQADMQLDVEADDEVRPLTIETDPGAVEQILLNLVDNACKYAAGAADRRIHLQCRAAGNSVAMSVCDHGPGIQPEDHKRLFRPFSKSAQEAARTAPGVGLGLALSERLARDLGGRLHVTSKDSDGACFVLTLPR